MAKMELVRGKVFPYWRCSACKKVHYVDEPVGVNYCPGCGAKIESIDKIGGDD